LTSADDGDKCYALSTLSGNAPGKKHEIAHTLAEAYRLLRTASLPQTTSLMLAVSTLVPVDKQISLPRPNRDCLLVWTGHYA